MKSPPSTSVSPTATMTTSDTDFSLSHTMDDDITFEHVRHMPRRTQFVSTHRKLSWQYDRELKQHERDRKITHVEMARAKIVMAEKLSRLQDAKKEVERKKSEPGTAITTTTTSIPDRRSSAPSCLPGVNGSDSIASPTGGGKGDVTTTTTMTTTTTAAAMKHSHSASSFPVVAIIPEGTEMPDRDLWRARGCNSPPQPSAAAEGKRVAFTGLPSPTSSQSPAEEAAKCGRRATIWAEGVVEAASLPPHLVRRLSEFMDSIPTSALLTNPSSRRKDPSSSSSSSSSSSPSSTSSSSSSSGTTGPKPASAQRRQISDPGPGTMMSM